MVNIRQQVALCGTFFLLCQAIPMTLVQAYSETVTSADAQTIEAFRSHQSEYFSLNQPFIPSEGETETVQEFSFVDNTFRTTVGQPVILRFTSTLPANEVLVRIPQNGQILQTELSDGESIQHSHGEYWVLNSNSQQTAFELPVVFDTEGKYFVTIDHDSDHFYLEVENETLEQNPFKSDFSEEVEVSEDIENQKEDDQKAVQQEILKSEEENEHLIVVEPVFTKEEKLVISDELIAEENERILEEITDPLNRTSATASNWSQFRSAWNSSSTTSIGSTSAINFSSSILGDSLNTRSNSVEIAGQSPLNLGTSNNSLMMNNATLVIRSHIVTENSSSTAPIVGVAANSTSATIDLSNTTLFNRRSSPCISILGTSTNNLIRFSGGSQSSVRIHNTRAISPIQLNNSFIDFRNSAARIYIGSQEASSNWIPPITSNNSGTASIAIANNNIVMGGRYSLSSWDAWDISPLTTFSESWNSITAMIAGVNGTVINSASSDPGDFSERYLQNVTSINYRSLLLNARAQDGFEPPITTYSLFLHANPEEAGNPQAESMTIATNTSTTINANPNEGYQFISWEIVSGTGAQIADITAETTTFTMGSSDTVIQANYEEESTIVNPVDPLDPGTEVNPENPPILPEDQGRFSLDFASNFDFGTQVISSKDHTYYAKPQQLLAEDGTVLEGEDRPNYVQISDRRPTQERDGWELSVRQNEQFTGSAGELTGARLVLQNQQIATAQGGMSPGLQHTTTMILNPGGAKRTLLKAQGPEGEGTWIYRFGDADTAAQSVALEVPKGATPSATSYKTTLTWELSSVPNN